MRGSLALGLLVASGLLWAIPACAQSTHFLSPSAGITVKNVVIYKNGWGILTFVESFPELATCTPQPFGSVTYAQPLWIDMTASGVSGRQIYATALAALVLGKKLEGVMVVQSASPGWCDLQLVRLAQ